jgi:hypothetical protein
MSRARPRLRVLVAVAMGCVLLSGGVICAALVLALWPAQTTFNVTVETDRLEMTTEGPSNVHWTLPSVTIVEDDSGTSKTFDGSLALDQPVHALIERIGFGVLWIRLEARGPRQSAGVLYKPDDTPDRRLGQSLDIFVRDAKERGERGEHVLLALSGRVTSGRPVGAETPGSTAVLRRGTVSMLARSIFGSGVFEAGRIDLDAGDAFDVEYASDRCGQETSETVMGFVVADERPSLNAVYRAVACSGWITRPGGGERRRLAPSLLGRVLHDELFQALSVVLAGVVSAITLVAALFGAWDFFEENHPASADSLGPPSVTPAALSPAHAASAEAQHVLPLAPAAAIVPAPPPTQSPPTPHAELRPVPHTRADKEDEESAGHDEKNDEKSQVDETR